MSKFNYDSYCGIYCGACSVLVAYRDGHKDKMAANYVEDARLKCHGCKSDSQFFNCTVCKVRDCAKSKEVERCSDCKHFTDCKILREQQKAAKILPHLSANIKNLKTIKEVGLNQWLSMQEEQWKCPQCQTPTSWYATNCHSCGRDLKDQNYQLSLFKFKIFKGLMGLATKKE